VKFAVVTFGCRVNQADSQAIEAQLVARGAEPAAPEQADLVIVNSCSVTASADQGVRQTVRRVSRANPSVSVVVTGCYATRRPDEVASLPGVATVVSNLDKDRLVSLLPVNDAADHLTTAERFGTGDASCGAEHVPGLGGRTALTLRVQTGCEQACSYCIIPQTRGPSRSRPMAMVLNDIARAAAAGYKEIVITGVHLGSYGRDLDDPSSLTRLVERLAAWETDVLFRISSLEPMDCTPQLVELVASSPRLAPHFHLPLQHGSDAMLQAMRRPYTVREYIELIDRIHTLLPDAAIGSDIIVGFPGERAGHVDEMVRLLRDLPLSHLHVFPYSDRPGTDAELLPEKVGGAEIRSRARSVRDIGAQMQQRFREAQHGRVLRALTVDDGWSGVTANYLKVRLDVQRPRNEWVSVEVDSGSTLRGLVR
jgi:threonylcarbamoyladenosine tRNA methylthiotransferase MtaB